VVCSRAGSEYPFDLGRTGQFYVENLESGNFAALVTTTDGLTCAFKADLPNPPSGLSSVTSVDAYL
jgi:hypothetical protein